MPSTSLFFGDTYSIVLVDDLRADLETEGHMGIHVGDFTTANPI